MRITHENLENLRQDGILFIQRVNPGGRFREPQRIHPRGSEILHHPETEHIESLLVALEDTHEDFLPFDCRGKIHLTMARETVAGADPVDIGLLRQDIFPHRSAGDVVQFIHIRPYRHIDHVMVLEFHYQDE